MDVCTLGAYSNSVSCIPIYSSPFLYCLKLGLSPTDFKKPSRFNRLRCFFNRHKGAILGTIFGIILGAAIIACPFILLGVGLITLVIVACVGGTVGGLVGGITGKMACPYKPELHPVTYHEPNTKPRQILNQPVLRESSSLSRIPSLGSMQVMPGSPPPISSGSNQASSNCSRILLTSSSVEWADPTSTPIPSSTEGTSSRSMILGTS